MHWAYVALVCYWGMIGEKQSGVYISVCVDLSDTFQLLKSQWLFKIYFGAGAKCGGTGMFPFVPIDVVLHLEFTLIIKMDLKLVQRFWSGLFGFTGYGGVFLLLLLVCVGFCLFYFCRGRNVLFLLLFVINVDFVIPEPGWITAKRNLLRRTKAKASPCHLSPLLKM